VRISPETGLVTSAADADAIFEIFRDGHVPELQAEDTSSAGFGGTIYDDDQDLF
jgi:hypothetical protein